MKDLTRSLMDPNLDAADFDKVFEASKVDTLEERQAAGMVQAVLHDKQLDAWFLSNVALAAQDEWQAGRTEKDVSLLTRTRTRKVHHPAVPTELVSPTKNEITYIVKTLPPHFPYIVTYPFSSSISQTM